MCNLYVIVKFTCGSIYYACPDISSIQQVVLEVQRQMVTNSQLLLLSQRSPLAFSLGSPQDRQSRKGPQPPGQLPPHPPRPGQPHPLSWRPPRALLAAVAAGSEGSEWGRTGCQGAFPIPPQALSAAITSHYMHDKNTVEPL